MEEKEDEDDIGRDRSDRGWKEGEMSKMSSIFIISSSRKLCTHFSLLVHSPPTFSCNLKGTQNFVSYQPLLF